MIDADGRGRAILVYSRLITEAQALGQALLDRDTRRSYDGASRIASLARLHELQSVVPLADDLAKRLTVAHDSPGVGLGPAYDRLSRALGQLLENG